MRGCSFHPRAWRLPRPGRRAGHGGQASRRIGPAPSESVGAIIRTLRDRRVSRDLEFSLDRRGRRRPEPGRRAGQGPILRRGLLGRRLRGGGSTVAGRRARGRRRVRHGDGPLQRRDGPGPVDQRQHGHAVESVHLRVEDRTPSGSTTRRWPGSRRRRRGTTGPSSTGCGTSPTAIDIAKGNAPERRPRRPEQPEAVPEGRLLRHQGQGRRRGRSATSRSSTPRRRSRPASTSSPRAARPPP